MASISYNQMLKDSKDPLEVEVSGTVEITNIHVPGGEVLSGPFYFQFDDSINDTIENLVEDNDLPKKPKEYNMVVTTAGGVVNVLQGIWTVEEYCSLLSAYDRIELTLEEPPAVEQMPPQNVGVEPKQTPQT